MTLLDIAFLKDVDAKTIAFWCSVPALLFVVYVLIDDAMQARAHHSHDTHHGDGKH